MAGKVGYGIELKSKPGVGGGSASRVSALVGDDEEVCVESGGGGDLEAKVGAFACLCGSDVVSVGRSRRRWSTLGQVGSRSEVSAG